MKKLIFSFILLFCGTCFTAQGQNEEINNQTVIELLKEGFSSEDIIGAIESSSNRNLTYSIAVMRELKAAGADSDLMHYIQQVAKKDFGYEGVLWWNTDQNDGKPMKLHRCMFEKEKSGGWGAGAALLGAAAGALTNNTLGRTAAAVLVTSAGEVNKLVVQGSQAKNVVKTDKPVFRFYFPKEENNSFNDGADSWYFGIMNNIESPNEFQCVKMNQKKDKRTFPKDVNYTIAGFSAKKATRNIVDFTVNDLSNSVFEVSFNEPLEPGEYVFFYKNGMNSPFFQEHVFGFDFSVQ